MARMKDAFLRKDDFSVIYVNWDAGDGLWDLTKYRYVAKKVGTVGYQIAQVADNVIRNGNSQASRLYCVGHSLGAHVCGQAGRFRKFGRITGLDPAGPYFNSLPITSGLNPGAADMVDVIHTDGDGLGTMRQLGHVDFYPNGGKHQPKCITSIKIDCSHSRVIQLYTVSIERPCFTSHHQCPSDVDVDILHINMCSYSKTAVQSMGFSAKYYSARGIFYLRTTGICPYCVA